MSLSSCDIASTDGKTEKILRGKHWVIWCLLLPVSAVSAIAEGDTKMQYLLGPQDRLMIRVYDLRKNAGEAYQWAALSGEFSVNASGTVSMPIIGEVAAEGRSTSALSAAIAGKLKVKADLADEPVASVEVIKYRPFYVMGSVQQPGKYEFQPGLTVLQAISTAQGMVRAADLNMARRDAMTNEGEMSSLDAERRALQAKEARLTSEIANIDSVRSDTAQKNSTTSSKPEQAVKDEALLFDTRRDAVNAEAAAIARSKANFEQELVTLDAKSKSLDRQIEINRKELDQISDLVSKGLAITPRKLAAEQAQTGYESSKLDVQLATLRTREALSRAERDKIEIQAKYRKESLDELLLTRAKLNQNAAKFRTAQKLFEDASRQIPGLELDDDNTKVVYSLTRVRDGQSSTWTASEGSQLEPGDVLRVIVKRSPHPVDASLLRSQERTYSER